MLPRKVTLGFAPIFGGIARMRSASVMGLPQYSETAYAAANSQERLWSCFQSGTSLIIVPLQTGAPTEYAVGRNVLAFSESGIENWKALGEQTTSFRVSLRPNHCSGVNWVPSWAMA